MKYFPVFMEMEQSPCLIVGGGRIAYRKAKQLLEYGADITVIGKELCQEITDLCKEQKLRGVLGSLQDSDLGGYYMVIVATDDTEENARIANLCRARKLLVNSVDDIENCSFIMPAIVREKDLTIAISTGGKSPQMAQRIKEELKHTYGTLYGEIVEHLGELRPRIKKTLPTEALRKSFYSEMIELALFEGKIPTKEQSVQILARWKEVANHEDNQNRNQGE